MDKKKKWEEPDNQRMLVFLQSNDAFCLVVVTSAAVLQYLMT